MRDDVPRAPVILKPHEPVSERVLLPGDPGRALRLATQLIDGPRMLNHHRGLWGYSGRAEDGELLTIQSTGLGGPSAAAVVAELVTLGARRLIRVGTAAGIGATPLGAIVVADTALAADGTSRALGASERVEADAELSNALALACGAIGVPAARILDANLGGTEEHAAQGAGGAVRRPAAAAGGRGDAARSIRGLVASADIHDPVLAAAWVAAGALACDLATAAVFAVARTHGAAAGAVLGVTRTLGDELADDALESLEAALGAAARRALA